MLENHKQVWLQVSQGKSSNLAYKKHKKARMKSITGSNWKETVFCDEKRFFLDGPDSCYTYIKMKRTLDKLKMAICLINKCFDLVCENLCNF